jgi:hypothetical protein
MPLFVFFQILGKGLDWEQTVSFENGEDVDEARVDPVNDPVTTNQDFADVLSV